MRRITRYLLWLFVFTVPWDVVTIPYAGSVSRLAGMAAIGLATLTALVGMRIRKPHPILALAVAFGVWCGLTLLWTLSYEATYIRATTYAQLVLSLWMVRELIRSQEQADDLLIAYCLGAFVPMASLLRNYEVGSTFSEAQRFSATGVNANDLAMTLVLGVPIAWHLMLSRRGVPRLLGIVYFILAPVSVLLTGTRGSYLALVCALMIVPATLPRLSFKAYGRVAVLLVVVTGLALFLVPNSIWDRAASIKSEIEGGRMTGRRGIWQAGLAVFVDHPLAGVGAGAYGPAVQNITGNPKTTSHSTPLSVLVEEGLIGLTIFSMLLGACIWVIIQLPPPRRQLWSTVMLAWLVGSASINWEYRKSTWLMFGLLAAQAGLRQEVRVAKPSRRYTYSVAVGGDRPPRWSRA